MADGCLNFDTNINSEGFEKGLKSLSDMVGDIKPKLKSLAMAVTAVFSVKKLVDFGRQSIETASDLAEVQNVVDTAFGESKQKMEDFADTAVKTYGISKLTAKQTGSNFMAMAAGMGLANDSASDMAMALTGLSADMASFYNVGQDVASTALKSIFTGETETLKQFGIVMTDANLQAYALSKGITKSTADMSQAEKVQLRYNYVMSQTALAQGDFAKTSDSWANQTRILSEQWKEFGATIGTVLMNVLLPAVKAINSLLSQLIALAQRAARALSEAFGFELSNSADEAQSIVKSTSQAADNYSDIADNAQQTQEAQEGSLASFDQMNKLNDESKSDSTGVSGAGEIMQPSGTSVEVDTGKAESDVSALADSLKKKFETMFEPLQKAWDKCGNGLVKSMKSKWTEIGGLLSDVGKSFAEVWSNGTGQRISEDLLEIWTNINNTIGSIAKNLRTAWNENNIGTSIVQNIANAYEAMFRHTNDISKKISEWADEVDFTPILTGFNELTKAIAPINDDIGSGLSWLFDNVLLPMASWTIEDAIPTFLTTLADVLEGLRSVWETAAPVLKEKLWDEFLQPIAKWSAGASLTILKCLGKAFRTICESVDGKSIEVLVDLAKAMTAIYLAAKGKDLIEKWGKSLSGLGTVFQDKLKALDKPITASATEGGTTFATKFMSVVGAAIAGWEIGTMIRDAIGQENLDEFFFPIFDAVVSVWNSITNFFTETIPSFCESIKETFLGYATFFSDIWQGIKDIFSSVTEWFTNIFESAWNGIVSVWSGTVNWFSDVWQGIRAVFSSVGSWFGNIFSSAYDGIRKAFATTAEFFRNLWVAIKAPFKKVADWFKNIFSKAWQAVKDVFSTGGKIFDGIKEGIAGVFTTVVNGLIGGINKVIAAPLEFLNGILNDIRDIEIAGFTPFDEMWGYDPITIPEIPKLAQGAVIPPNSEFLAVLGDQKRGTNIEAPLDTITQAVLQALVSYGGAGGNQKISVTIPLTLNGRTITQIVIDDINDYIKRNGRSPIRA